MDIERRLAELISIYEKLYDAIESELKGRATDTLGERLEDLTMLRETGLVLISSLRDLQSSEAIPFDMDLNELSLIIDDFISTSNDVMKA